MMKMMFFMIFFPRLVFRVWNVILMFVSFYMVLRHSLTPVVTVAHNNISPADSTTGHIELTCYLPVTATSNSRLAWTACSANNRNVALG